MYPAGSTQQQVTLYPHRDENNIWLMTNQTDPEIGYDQSGIPSI
jgi:dolichyl-phosphate-mannose-protein mannosyltransferase